MCYEPHNLTKVDGDETMPAHWYHVAFHPLLIDTPYSVFRLFLSVLHATEPLIIPDSLEFCIVFEHYLDNHQLILVEYVSLQAERQLMPEGKGHLEI